MTDEEAKADERAWSPQGVQARQPGEPEEPARRVDAWRLAAVAALPCYRPLKAYRKAGGGVAFNSKEGFSDRPLELPCGQCLGCRLKRSREWALRCVHEASLHTHNCFITLTYDDQHLPADGSLDVDHWKLFMKRVRKAFGARSVRYYHCGEYGDVSLRPHYHALLFGVDFSADREVLSTHRGNPLYRSPTLERLWGKGFAPIGQVTWQSAAYCARYVIKKQTGEAAEAAYTRVDPNTGECWEVKPPYTTMSRRPGIGAGWFEKFGESDVLPVDEVVHDGRRYRPPRFYDERLSEQELAAVKRKRRKAAGKWASEQEPDRLRVRETVAEAKAVQLKRNL